MASAYCACVTYAALLLALLHHVTAQNSTSMTEVEQATDKCPMGASMDMERDELLGKLFPGLFVDKKDLKPRKMNQNLAKMVKWKSRKTLTAVAFSNVQDCCEMVTEVFKPIAVEHGGASYDVVHLSSEEQLVTMTSCVNVNTACSSSGKCVHRLGYNWVLVWDPALAYYPPVKFVPMSVYVGCDCQ